MKDLRLNETPVRTSVNFGINDILLKDFKLPENTKFTNIEIENDTKSIKVENKEKLVIEKFNYSISNEIESLDKNSKLEIILNENELKEQVKVDFKTDINNKNLVDDMLIKAKSNSNGVVIVRYDSLDDTNSFVSTKLKIEAEEKANVQVIVVNMLNDNSTNILAMESSIEENANVNVIIVDFGGKTSVSNYYTKLVGNMSVSTIDTIYLGDKERLIDINYIAHLLGQKTDVNIEVQGALKDSSRKNFKGTIDFKRGSTRAKGNENEFCMLLSPSAKSKALPMLLCTEDDVEGNHSTASGKVNKAELFYLMSRGISQKEAMKLLVRAKFAPIIDKIEDESLRKEILDKIDIKLN